MNTQKRERREAIISENLHGGSVSSTGYEWEMMRKAGVLLINHLRNLIETWAGKSAIVITERQGGRWMKALYRMHN